MRAGEAAVRTLVAARDLAGDFAGAGAPPARPWTKTAAVAATASSSLV
jgi:hypothetical protein